MDLEDDCIEALHTGSITEMCVKTAKLKWNLLQLSSVTTESKNIESSCCAMYDALNCLQKSSCNTCPQEDLHDTARYRIRALQALGETLCRKVPYGSSVYQKKCLNATEATVPLQLHCENELQSSTVASTFKGALILGLVMLGILIFVATLGLVIHLMAQGAEEGEEAEKKRKMAHLYPERHGSKTFKLHRSSSFSGKYLPVRKLPQPHTHRASQVVSVSATKEVSPSKVPLKKNRSLLLAKESTVSKKSLKSVKEKSASSRRRKKSQETKVLGKRNSATSVKAKDIKK